MTRKEIIALVRRFISDEQAVAFAEGGNLEEPEGTAELLNYLDRAVDAYSRRQAAAKDIRLLARMNVYDGAELPEDFIAFAGNVPVEVSVGHAVLYGYPPFTTIPVKYFARLPYVTAYESDDEDMDYTRDEEMTIAALAAIYALNKHEFNVSQDLLLLGLGGGEANANAGQ